ncbi:MAG: ribosome silencing factor [Actinomycetota bacterium]|jgi:ribosome-associated protein|nr:ribosome silencing factor [Actinomycetota bacterium]
MTESPQPSPLPELVEAAARGASKLQAHDIVALEVGDVMAITDWFVVASGTNVRQVRRLAESVEDEVKAAGGDGPLRVEGLEDATWVLLDFGPFVVHVFHEDTRAFYDIERLWSDVPRVEYDDAPPADLSAEA